MNARWLLIAFLLWPGSLTPAAELNEPGDSSPPAFTLADARSEALQRHPRVQIAELQARIAGETLTGARAAYLPTADLYADAVEAGNANTRLLAGGLNNPVIYDRTADGIAVTQLITDFGRTTNLIASAKLSARAETERSAATRSLVLLNVDTAYYRTLEADAILRVAHETVAAQDTLARQIGALAKSSLRSDLDVSFAQVGLEQSRLLEQQANGGAASARAELANALGEPAPRQRTLAPAGDDVTPDVATAEAAVDEAMRGRPDLRALEFQGEAATRAARAEKDRNYPVVAAIGTMGNAITHDNRLPNKYAAGGITFDLPLFAGGAYAARARAAELRAQAAQESIREAQDAVSRDVRVAWIRLETARQREQTLQLLVHHARDAFTLAQARYKVGSSSIVELNQAELSATNAEMEAADSHYDVLIAESVLGYATGRLH